jgi:hypothetical protein
VHGRHNGQRGTDTYDSGRKSGRHGLDTIPHADCDTASDSIDIRQSEPHFAQLCLLHHLVPPFFWQVTLPQPCHAQRSHRLCLLYFHSLYPAGLSSLADVRFARPLSYFGGCWKLATAPLHVGLTSGMVICGTYWVNSFRSSCRNIRFLSIPLVSCICATPTDSVCDRCHATKSFHGRLDVRLHCSSRLAAIKSTQRRFTCKHYAALGVQQQWKSQLYRRPHGR